MPPEDHEDQHPEEHGAFVIAPDAGDLEDEGLERMGMVGREREAEIGNGEGLHHGKERHGHQHHLEDRRLAQNLRQPLAPAPEQ
jgi:hypothetical protein